MALTKKDLQAIAALMETEREYTSRMMDSKLEPIKDDIAALKQGQSDLQESMQTIRTSQLKVELEQYPRIAAALDGADAGLEKNAEHDKRIAALERQSDNQSHRIFALEQLAKAK